MVEADAFDAESGKDAPAPKAEPKKPVSTEKREEIKQGLTAPEANADELQIKALKAVLKKLKEVDSTQEEFIQQVAIKTEGFTKISKSACEQLVLKIGDVMSNSFRDKVVQHSLCDNVLEILLRKNFLYDNYASQVGKGTDFGLNRLDGFMHKFYRQHGLEGWVLKCDIRKYFYSIPHEYLKRILEPYVPEEDVRWLLWYIIDSTADPGIPIGNQSSQLLAVLCLSPLDHFIKEKLGIKYYGRYMDDFYLIHPYHLVRIIGGDATVYGWVDKGTFTKA